MRISLNKVSKRFQLHWVLRGIDLEISAGSAIGIRGVNGSGKSTLLKIIAQFLESTEGTISYRGIGKTIAPSQLYKHMSFAAPYMELIEELTVLEQVKTYGKFKDFLPGIDAENLYARFLLPGNSQGVKSLSSGMRQRLRLGLSILTDSKLLILDEPSSYLDKKSIDWYHRLLRDHMKGRTVIIASNSSEDFLECQSSYTLSGGQLIESGG